MVVLTRLRLAYRIRAVGFVLVIAGLSLVEGCMVPIPATPSVTDAHISFVSEKPLKAPMQVAVVGPSGSRDENEVAVRCVRKKLEKAGAMTSEEIAQAQQMIRDWKSGDWPSAANQLGASY